MLIERYGYANLTAHESYYMIDFETGNLTFYHWATGLGYHAWLLPIGTNVKVLYSTIEENEKDAQNRSLIKTRAQETEIVAFSKYILKILWKQLFKREH